jgi:hypothetical protein
VIRGFRKRPYDSVTVSAIQVASGPEVNVYAFHLGGESAHAWLAPETAIEVARLVETLAGASPGQHQQVAKAIREAAKVITATEATQDKGPAARQAPAQAPDGMRLPPLIEPQQGTARPQGIRPQP